MDRNYSFFNSLDRDKLKPPKAKVKAMAVIRDKYGRIVVDEAVFFDDEKLKKLKDEVRKNGGYTSGSNP